MGLLKRIFRRRTTKNTVVVRATAVPPKKGPGTIIIFRVEDRRVEGSRNNFKSGWQKDYSDGKNIDEIIGQSNEKRIKVDDFRGMYKRVINSQNIKYISKLEDILDKNIQHTLNYEKDVEKRKALITLDTLIRIKRKYLMHTNKNQSFNSYLTQVINNSAKFSGINPSNKRRVITEDGTIYLQTLKHYLTKK